MGKPSMTDPSPSPRSQSPVVLVTGSSGLLGSRICERLAERYQVVGLDVEPPDSPVANCTWRRCDLTDQSDVEQTLKSVQDLVGESIASVIHLAAYYDFSGEPSPLYRELTVEGTRRLLEALHEFSEVEQFIFSSSVLVMKPCEPGELLTEESPTNAEWAYPQSKLDAEKEIRRHKKSIPAVILRIAGVYDEAGHSLPITQNIRRIAEKQLESYFFPGDAQRGQAFVHLDDVAACFDRAVESRHQLSPYETFLVAEDECLSYAQLQDLIGELIFGTDDWPTIRIPKPVAKAGAWVKDQWAPSEDEEPFIKPWMVDLADAHYPVNTARARDRLGWEPTHRLSQTLPEMIRRLKKDPRRWYEVNNLACPDQAPVLPGVQE